MVAWGAAGAAVQLHQYAFGLTAAQCERRVPNADYEGIPTRSCLCEYLDLLAVDEAELDQSALERAECSAGSNADHARGGPWGQRTQAHKGRFEHLAAGGRNCIHGAKYG
jgi:hypothetical protein